MYRVSISGYAAASFFFVALTGCSTHPDVSDITRLTVFDIVQRIQCEAADTIKDVYEERGFIEKAELLKQFDAKFSAKTEEYSTLFNTVSGEFGTEVWQLAEARYTIELQIKQLLVRIQRLQAKPSDPGSDAADDALAKTYLAEGQRLLAQRNSLENTISAIKKLQRLQKEIAALDAEAMTKFSKLIKYEKTSAVFEFRFLITENNDAMSDGTFVWPFALGTFSLTYKVGDKKQRESDREVRIASNFAKLNQLPCSDVEQEHDARLPSRYPITGNIGLEEVIADYQRTVDAGYVFKEKATYQDKIKFTTTVNGKLSATATLNRQIGPKSITLNASLSADRKDVHQLTIFLVPGEAGGAWEPPKPQEQIIIKRMPEVRTRPVGAGAVE